MEKQTANNIFINNIINLKQNFMKYKFLRISLLSALTVLFGGTALGAAGEDTKLIDFPNSKDGITLVEGGTASYATVKIHENKDAVDCIKFANSGTNNGVTLAVEGGFKAGDVIEIAGAVSLKAADEGTKRACVEIYTETNGTQTKTFTTQDFINGQLSADDPVVEMFTLESDCENLVLARNGGTGANVTLLTITRASSGEGGDEPSVEPGTETINADIDCTGTIVDGILEGTVNFMTIGEGGAATEIVNNSYMKLGDHDNVVTIPAEQYAGTRDVVETSFDMAWGNKNGMGNGIALKDAEGETIAYFEYARWGGGSDNLGIDDIYAIMGGHSGNVAVWNNKTHFVITIDYAKKTISTVATLGTTTKEYSAALTNANPVASFTVNGYNAGGNADRAGLFGNLVIKTIAGNYNVATANYTVKWVEGTEVVKEETREGDVDSEITLLPADLANFLVDEVKYIVTENDAAGKTIAADGTTVVTISVRKAEKWAYTVTTSYNGNTLDWTASGEVWEDEPNVTISYPRYLASGTTLVEKKPNGNDLQQGIVVTNDGFTTDFEYAATEIEDLYFVKEAEDLDTELAQSGTSFGSRVSCGKIIYGAEGTLFELPAGKYIVTLGVIGGNTTNHIVEYTVSAGDKQIAEFECTGNFLTLGKSEEFTVEDESVAITFTSNDASTDRGIDLVYVQKTGDVVTGINTVNAKAENDEVYNLQGQKVEKAQKGLYIVNGKKMVVK